jgi:hypothetical protein
MQCRYWIQFFITRQKINFKVIRTMLSFCLDLYQVSTWVNFENIEVIGWVYQWFLLICVIESIHKYSETLLVLSWYSQDCWVIGLLRLIEVRIECINLWWTRANFRSFRLKLSYLVTLRLKLYTILQLLSNMLSLYRFQH